MLFIYTTLLYLLIPVLLLRLIVRGLHNRAYWHRWAERFGWLPASIGRAEIWLHAVSVGEARAAIPLVEALLAKDPVRIIMTTMTPTGSDQVVRSFGDRVQHCYAPYDLPGAVRRFLDRVEPRIVVIMETELWPNILLQCEARDIHCIMANVRISQRSFTGYRRVRGFVARVLQTVDAFAVQTQSDAQRLEALGAPPERLHIAGNIKSELKLPASLQEVGQVLRREFGQERQVWVAGSTHEGEDEMILACFDALRARFPRLLLVLVPRHPERFSAVARLAERGERRVIQRSQQRGPLPDGTDVYIGDTMGDLPLLYATADVAFVGGSLVPHGGHNILEPCATGTPVVFGPHMFNFAELSALALRHEAGIQVNDADELTAAVDRLLRDANLRFRMGEAGKRIIEQSKGAVARTMALIEQAGSSRAP